MKTSKIFRISIIASLLVLCLLSFCSAAVSVDDVTSVVCSQVNLTAKVTDIEAPSYQWYTCKDTDGTGSVIIDGATSDIYTTPYLDQTGKTFYKVVVNGTDSDIATVTATMPTEPVVFRFNNESDMAYWSAGSKASTIYNGSKVFYYLAGTDGVTTFTSVSAYNDFYLQGYHLLFCAPT